MDKDYIVKPLKPHRVLLPEEIPTEEELEKRMEINRRMNELGIETGVFDGDNGEEDLDKLEASLYIMQGKEVPPELVKILREKMQKKSKIGLK